MNHRNTPTSPTVDPRDIEPKAEPDNLFSLFDQQQPTAERRATVPERFEGFNEQNPKVLDHMIRIAREWIRETGSPKVGINGLLEQVRWRVAVDTSDPDFKINNIFAPFYSRLIPYIAADLTDAFEYRKSIADEWIVKYIARMAREVEQNGRAA